MKKYYLADVLTLLETVCAVTLTFMSVFHVSADYALWTFATGVICDALDGPCARAFHYPNDGKYRWWREKAELTDKISDLMLGIAALFYIGCCISKPLGQYGFIAAFVIGCLVQVIVYPTWGGIECLDLRASHPSIALALISIRRIMYAGGMIIGIFILIHSTSWSNQVKIAMNGFLVICGLVALKLKHNRLIEDETPL